MARDFNDDLREGGEEVVRAEHDRARPYKNGPDSTIKWPEPQPIDAPLYPVPAFDAEALLPDGLRDFVTDAAYRMPCAPEYVAAATIAFVGSIIGARCAIRPKQRDSWLVVPNLWGGIVGDPSQKKSPAMSEAMKPLSRLIAIAMKEHEADLTGAKCDEVVRAAGQKDIEAKIKCAVKKGDTASLEQLKEELRAYLAASPDEPTLRRYRTNDTTVEKLGELLRDNPAGILLVRDELVGLIASWDKTGREGDRQFFLEAWNGTDSFDTDRIGRGTILIPNLCVTLFGGMQPDKLTGYLEQASDALANDGLLQRFQLLVYPDPTPWEYRDSTPNERARKRADLIFEKLAGFDPAEWGATPAGHFAKFPYLHFDSAAQAIYVEWSTNLHKRIEAEPNPLIRQHLEKYDKLFPALALIFHLVDRAAGGSQNEVTEACARRAAAWCGFLEPHARRCYGLLADQGLRSAQALAKKLKEPELPQSFNPQDFTARDLRRNRWRYLSDEDAVEAALDWLESRGWLSRRTVPSGERGGRTTERYTVNPRLRHR